MTTFRGKKQVLGFRWIYLRKDGKYEGLLKTHKGKRLSTGPMPTIAEAWAAREKLRAAQAGGDDHRLASFNRSAMDIDEAANESDGPYDGSAGPRSMLQQQLEKQQQRYAQETAVWTDRHQDTPVLSAAERQKNVYEPDWMPPPLPRPSVQPHGAHALDRPQIYAPQQGARQGQGQLVGHFASGNESDHLQKPSWPGSHPYHHYQEQQPQWHHGQDLAAREGHAVHMQHEVHHHSMRPAGHAGNTNSIRQREMTVAARHSNGQNARHFAAAGRLSPTYEGYAGKQHQPREHSDCKRPAVHGGALPGNPWSQHRVSYMGNEGGHKYNHGGRSCAGGLGLPTQQTPVAVPGTSAAASSLRNGRATPACDSQLPGRNSLPLQGAVSSAHIPGESDHPAASQPSKETAVAVPSESAAAPVGPDGKPLLWEGPLEIPAAGRGLKWQLNQCTGAHVTMSNIYSRPLWELMEQLGVPPEHCTLELLELLGQGSYGAVYRAEMRWPNMEPDAQAPSVAVKLFQLWDQRSFTREVWGLGLCLPLKHVVDLMAVGQARVQCLLVDTESEDDQQPADLILPCLVMEWMPGGTLEGSLTWSEDDMRPIACALVTTLSDMQRMGLGSTGRYGVVHRDVKAMNCLRDIDGTVKLCDFGQCHVFELTAAGPCMHSVHVGTKLYQSPAQLARFMSGYGGEVDGYALGILLVSLLYGGWSSMKAFSTKLNVAGSLEFSLYEFVTTRLAFDTEDPPLGISSQMRMFICDCCTRHLPEVLRNHEWLSMGKDGQHVMQ